MASNPVSIQNLSKRYHRSNDDEREQLFEELYAHYYDGPRTIPDGLSNTLKALLPSLDVLPTTADAETLDIVVIQEICFGLQRFCLSTPPGIDYAWNATTLFISQLGQMQVRQGQFDIYAFVVANFKYWIAEFPSDDNCNMENATSSAVRDSDASIVSITQDQWDDDSVEQLQNLTENRRARKRCVVHKVIAARALRDGYAPSGPQSTAFPGACELRFIELSLGSLPGHTRPMAEYATGSDAIAATFLLRACAKSLLSRLPIEGCNFHELWELPPIIAGEDGRVARLTLWQSALERLIISKQSQGHGFALTCYAGLAFENLQDPRDETSEELFSWDKIAF